MQLLEIKIPEFNVGTLLRHIIKLQRLQSVLKTLILMKLRF